MNGKNEACAMAFGTEIGVLVNGVPDVEIGHGPRELAVDVVTSDIVDIAAESADVVFGYKECDVETVGKFMGVLLVPAAIIETNLA